MDTKDDQAYRVKRVIGEHLGADESELKNDSSLVADLGAGSLDLVEITMAIEDEFAIEVPDDDIASLVTVQHVLDYVAKRVGEPA